MKFSLDNISEMSTQQLKQEMKYSKQEGEQIYINLVENNNDKEQWTANLNCQLFAQKLIEHLYFDYPSNILTYSDIPPTLIDVSILSLRSSACSREKLRPARRSTST